MSSGKLQYLGIFLIGCVLFLPFLGQVHLFDWDEINFAESAREMLLTGDYSRVQINFQPFWEKPPLFIWLQAISMWLFGVNEFAARFPNAIIGALTLSLLYAIMKRENGVKHAWIWPFVYAGSILPHFYFRTAIIDPLFNLLIFLGVYAAYRSLDTISYKWKWPTISGICIGLAILTKGPVALVVFALTVGLYFILTIRESRIKVHQVLYCGLAIFFTASLWFVYEIFHHGWWFIEQFVVYQIKLFRTEDAGHGGPWFYHPIVLIVGCFPASVFFVSAYFRRKTSTNSNKSFAFWCHILFWVHLILFSIVKTKIVHYSSLCYFPLTYLAAIEIRRILIGETKFRKSNILLMILGIFWSILLFGLVWIGRNKAQIIPYIKDEFAVANLNAEVEWPMYLYLFSILFALTLFYYFITNKSSKIVVLFISVLISIEGMLLAFVPRIEAYSQSAMIDFLSSKSNQDVYIAAVGFKSYAQYFYSARSANYDLSITPERLLDSLPLAKQAFVVAKSNRTSEIEKTGLFTKLSEKNGYCWYKRDR